VRLTVSGDDLEFQRGETVLHTLTRHGIGVPAACGAGVCRACLLRVVHGDPGPDGRAGLEDAMRADGYFLACMARPATDLTVALAAEDSFVPAELLSVTPAGARVIRVRIRPRRPLDFRAGQHLAVRNGAGVARVYSIANLPAQARRDGIEFHVRVYPGGAMSEWLAGAAPGTPISLGRPSGACCYQPDDGGAPLLLAGTGTGIAPLAAVLRDALARGHRGPAIIIRGAADAGGLYPGPFLPPAGEDAGPASVRSRVCLLSRGEDIVAAATAEFSRLSQPAAARAYLCGGPQVVARMRRALFLAGLSLRRIHGDEFAPAR
jgi:CDP-4-dehydro-6-deoxyglucose reductase, E3